MASPTSLAVAVDLEEYSRFEADRRVVTVSVLPGVPTSDVAVASIVGATTLDVTNGGVFNASSPPFTVRIGSGTMQETAVVNTLVGDTLTFAAPLAFAHSLCEPVAQVINLQGEFISLQLMKARYNRDVVVATIRLTYAFADPQTMTAQIDLSKVIDQLAAPRVRRGSYFIRAIVDSDPLVSADSPDFLVSMISLARFKDEWLHGADQHALDTEAVKNQPVLLAGVSVSDVSRGHQHGWFPLSYNFSDPGGCGTPVRLLSWCDGPVVAVQSGRTKYTLRKGKSQTDFIDVTVISVDALPRQSTAEDLLVDREPMSDASLRGMIDKAISWVEDVALQCYLEPTRVVTEIDPNQITYAAGTDIPTFVLADWDKRVDALTYTRPAPGHWINQRMPYFPTITFYSLYGKVSNVRIVDIALEWIEIDERGGFFELVPFNQEIAFNFIGLIWVESLRGPVPIPNFWNFDALVGFRDTPAIVLELIGKKAAIDALTKIGQAFRPGIASQSVSRDGVSESVSYLTSGMYGIYSGVIKTYAEWLDKNLPALRGTYRGANMVVV